MLAERPRVPVKAADALTLKLPLSVALVVHAEKPPLSKPSLKIRSTAEVAVRVGVNVAVGGTGVFVGVNVEVGGADVLVGAIVAVDGTGVFVGVRVGVNVEVGGTAVFVGVSVNVGVGVLLGSVVLKTTSTQ